jgi:hypothetical protein
MTVFLLGGFIYYFLKIESDKKVQALMIIESNNIKIKKQQADKTKTDYNNQFPDIIFGEINIVSDTETTIKLETGVEYLISPARPESFFRDSGIKNGDSIEARGKRINENLFSLGSIINK